MRILVSLLAPLLSLAALALARSSTGDSVLVILEPGLDQSKFSRFFGGLRERGFELTFRAPQDAAPTLFEYNDPRFAHVILFAPTTKTYAPDITPQSLVALLAAGTNLLVALSPAQTPLASLAAEFGLVLPPPNTPLISHFPARPPPHTTVPIPLGASSPASAVALTPGTAPILFAGVPHLRSTNPLLVPVVSAPPESFAADAADAQDAAGADALVDAAERGGEGLWAGAQLGVVTGFQARTTGARAMWVGGVDVFSDDFAAAEVEKGVTSGNAVFVQDIAKWTFQETQVYRIDNTTHYRAGETTPRDTYTIKDHLVYSIRVSAYDAETGIWHPYSGLQDMQLEFTMLDPHIRTALRPVGAGKYAARFRAPDRHGVFKFVVDYKRKGQTHLQSATVVSLVPPRHDEYPRFLSAAWPYYAGAISTSVGFLVFSALWLGGEVEEQRKRSGKGKSE